LLLFESIFIATLTLSAWFTYKGQKGPFPYFLPFMVMVVSFEIPIDIWFKSLYGHNLHLKNLMAKLCIYYYLFVFYHYYRDRVWSMLLKYIILLYMTITLVWNFGFQDQDSIDYISYNAGYLILIPLMLLYLHEVIYKKDYYNVLRDPYVYFIFGILIFYTSSFPILGFINMLITYNPNYKAFYHLLNLGNIFLSLAYLGAVLCSQTKKPSIISS
jgi:hypothetical protein